MNGKSAMRNSGFQTAESSHNAVGHCMRAYTQTLRAELPGVVSDAVTAGGNAACEILYKELVNAPLRSAARSVVVSRPVFDATNPSAVAYAEKYSAELVTEISRETEKALRDTIARGYREQLSPQEIGRLVRGNVGLTTRQASAVSKLQETLKNNPGRLVYAGDRAIRVPANGMSATRLNREVTKYADKLLRNRGDLIARTEIMRATNEGQEQLWRQQISKGVLTGYELREWIATEDERICPICGKADGERRGFNEVFSAGVYSPPAHPACRCTLGISGVKRSSDAAKPAQNLGDNLIKKSLDTDARRLFKPAEKELYQQTVKDIRGSLTREGWQEVSHTQYSGNSAKTVYGRGTERIEVYGNVRKVEFQEMMPSLYNNQSEYLLTVHRFTGPELAAVEAPIASTPTAARPLNTWFDRKPKITTITEAGKQQGEALAKRATEELNRFASEYPELAALMQSKSGQLELIEGDRVGAITKKFGSYKDSVGLHNSFQRQITVAIGGPARRAEELYKIATQSTRVWSAGEDALSTFRHEYGHHIHLVAMSPEQRTEWTAIWNSFAEDVKGAAFPGGFNPIQIARIRNTVSEYASTNEKELFAESFRAYTHPDYGLHGNPRLPANIESFFERNLGRRVASDFSPVQEIRVVVPTAPRPVAVSPPVYTPPPPVAKPQTIPGNVPGIRPPVPPQPPAGIAVKINEDVVRDIRYRRQVLGETTTSIAKYYNIYPSQVSSIVQRKTWSQVL